MKKNEIVITGRMVLKASWILGMLAMLVRILMGAVFQLEDWLIIAGLLASMGNAFGKDNEVRE
ncbi:hypothetical protein GGG87_04695 [Streptococcus sp. zg-86]|uniref:Phage holin n=1 Tax=Streptococcus zhangguiae TaxID=2664091 RepID=A0A6I4RG95_9STRE|nr:MULTISPECIES: hypothetical protein [unclassified Streptococcus]MTB64291.1 hypothetical protein [Streptococcus sp. zg-86]MTB90601.1 hypothetical protein [Streptococcus sp. zg-36]MWV56404.1 hypothetical protein [Streptococcus sp. zg-70]QTH47389.1 hypothetical protein J5M87_07460 [Streptococcus sp. zg-86]